MGHYGLLASDLGRWAPAPSRASTPLGCQVCGGPTLTRSGTQRFLTACQDCFTPTAISRILRCPHKKKSFASRDRRPQRPVCLQCGAGIVTLTVVETTTGKTLPFPK